MLFVKPEGGLLPTYSAIAITFLFVSILPYGGPGHNLHLLSIYGVLVLAWISVSLAKQNLAHFSFAWGWLPVAMLAYGVWLFAAFLVSNYPYASFTTAIGLAVLPLTLVGWLMLPTGNRQRMWDLTWGLLLICSMVLAIWGVVDYTILTERAHGPLIDANAYAALMNLFLLPAICVYLRSSRFEGASNHPYLLLSIIALCALAQQMSLSRGALLAFLAALAVLLWSSRKYPAFRSRLPVLLVVLASTFVVVKMAPHDSGRSVQALLLSPARHLESDASIQQRLLMWKSTWRIIVEERRFVIGTGLGTFKSYYASYRDKEERVTTGNFAHNDYLQALQEGGIIELGFLVALLIFAPAWLLRKLNARTGAQNRLHIIDPTPGLMLGVLCISLHAAVNFIHYVAPIALLTGLYLARSWEVLQPQHDFNLLPSRWIKVKPIFVKGFIIVLLALPISGLALDGVVFKIFTPKDSILTRLEPDQRFTVLNATLAVRPSNPMPRVMYIYDLLDFAENTPLIWMRDQYFKQAEHEARTLSTLAPALATGLFLLGKVRATRGSANDLLLARDDLERAIKLVPASTGMRLELIKVYRKLGQEKDAYQLVLDANKWLKMEVDLPSLAAFAKEAQIVALNQNDSEEAAYWSSLYVRLSELGFPG